MCDGALLMKLRSHSSLCYRGFQSWPPVWTREFGPETFPSGEVGVLEDVHRSVLENQCYLVIQYNGSRYVGVLQCEDGKFFERVYRCLSKGRGKPIHELGELEIDLE
jgi:hypothetical protein